jgi:DNA polymerase-3 subunit alpha
MSLFGDEMGGEAGFGDRIEIPTLEFVRADQLRNEKEMLGLYISDHPLMGADYALRRRTDSTIADARERDDGTFLVLGGVITSFARKYTKRGDQMAVFVLEDLESSIEVTVFPKTLTEYGHLLADDVIVAVRGRVDRRDDSQVGFMAQKLEAIENLTMTGPRTVRMKLSASAVDEDMIERLKAILTEFPGDAAVILDMGPGKVLQLADSFSVNIDQAIGDLRVAFGDAVIEG